MIFILPPAILLTGLYLVGREMIPVMGAWKTGRLRTRGYAPKLVDRDIEPERFRRLINERLKIAGAAAVFILGALATVILHVT